MVICDVVNIVHLKLL